MIHTHINLAIFPQKSPWPMAISSNREIQELPAAPLQQSSCQGHGDLRAFPWQRQTSWRALCSSHWMQDIFGYHVANMYIIIYMYYIYIIIYIYIYVLYILYIYNIYVLYILYYIYLSLYIYTSFSIYIISYCMDDISCVINCNHM